MEWFILIGAGVFEAVMAAALSKSNGFKRLKPTLLFLAASVVSLLGLSIAMKDIPTGTAYAVWTGVGAALTVLWSFVTGQERATVAKALLLILLVGSVIGLKVVH